MTTAKTVSDQTHKHTRSMVKLTEKANVRADMINKPSGTRIPKVTPLILITMLAVYKIKKCQNVFVKCCGPTYTRI